MDNGEWLALTTLARSVGVPEASARRYADAFAEFLQVRRMGKANMYNVAGGAVLKRISDLFGQGLGRVQVTEILRGEYQQTHELEPVATSGDASPSANLPAIVRAEIGTALAEALQVVANQKTQIDALERRLTALEVSAGRASSWWKFWK